MTSNALLLSKNFPGNPLQVTKLLNSLGIATHVLSIERNGKACTVIFRVSYEMTAWVAGQLGQQVPKFVDVPL